MNRTRLAGAAAAVLLALPGTGAAALDGAALDAPALHGYLDRVEAAGFTGSVLVAQGDEVVLHRGLGTSSGDPLPPDAVYDIGSIAKQFTATAVVLLAERGALAVDDPVVRWFPAAPPALRAVTVAHLLTHAAGLDEHAVDDLAPLTRAEAEQRILAQRPRSAPGAAHHYSNSGYTLLASIVERATGRAFPEFVRTELFEPAGLRSTAFVGDGRLTGRPSPVTRANGEDTGPPTSWPGPSWGVLGNGGVLSTTGDLFTWTRALRSGAVLPPAVVAALFAPRIDQGDGTSYGYGWTIDPASPWGLLHTHNGGGIGGNSDLALYPGADRTVVVASPTITFRTLPVAELPVEVSLPATELREQLVTNLAAGDLGPLPAPTLPGWVVPALGSTAGAVLVGLVGVVVRRRRSAVNGA